LVGSEKPESKRARQRFGNQETCYEEGCMRGVLSLIVVSVALGVVGAAVGRPIATSPGPSRSTALTYAKRTYIVVARVGNVKFYLGTEKSVTAKDGSTITAFSITNDYRGTADSASSAVMVFRGGSFVGWASSRTEMSLTLEPSSGNAIRVLYPIWKAADHSCCPSGRELVSYTWNGTRIVASAQPPLIYGKQGALLHLTPSAAISPAKNLEATNSLKSQLVAAFAPVHQVSVSEIGGTVPGSVFYAYDTSTSTYWAVAYFYGSKNDSANVANSFQDAGSDGVFSRLASGTWRFRGAGFPMNTCVIPAAVRKVWAMTSPRCP
jgi:hypothetical protein